MFLRYWWIFYPLGGPLISALPYTSQISKLNKFLLNQLSKKYDLLIILKLVTLSSEHNKLARNLLHESSFLVLQNNKWVFDAKYRVKFTGSLNMLIVRSSEVALSTYSYSYTRNNSFGCAMRYYEREQIESEIAPS